VVLARTLFIDHKFALKILLLITAARSGVPKAVIDCLCFLLQPPVQAYAGTEGCIVLRMFFIFFFIKRVIFETAESTLAPNMAGRRA